ncbi:hypothetical protein [Deinococcus soli (ex Cha et al. 2016)]|uniref:hypothetical protein n=1 Tax=Deinococcus soli (ex Cha et al. 2016) TaxID=1309411 RepID=UPI00166C656C|nr:hypothetical protein [Deinococcus soli (ex Cha et al. 2016)]GGB79543.1 hypothetical protein GCM10008019_39720 [Deinococcus soli (ex Cha et al. 2016)]
MGTRTNPATFQFGSTLPLTLSIRHPRFKGVPRHDVEFQGALVVMAGACIAEGHGLLWTPQPSGAGLFLLLGALVLAVGYAAPTAMERVWRRAPSNRTPTGPEAIGQLVTSLPVSIGLFAGMFGGVLAALHAGSLLPLAYALAGAWVQYTVLVGRAYVTWRRTPPRLPRSKARA